MENYGKELILDLHNCDFKKMTRKYLKGFFRDLCKKIDMKRCALHFWDYKDFHKEYDNAPPHLKGISAVQFISTSNITIHTLDDMHRVYINIFSCKDFNSNVVEKTCLDWFGGEVVKGNIIKRK